MSDKDDSTGVTPVTKTQGHGLFRRLLESVVYELDRPFNEIRNGPVGYLTITCLFVIGVGADGTPGKSRALAGMVAILVLYTVLWRNWLWLNVAITISLIASLYGIWGAIFETGPSVWAWEIWLLVTLLALALSAHRIQMSRMKAIMDEYQSQLDARAKVSQN